MMLEEQIKLSHLTSKCKAALSMPMLDFMVWMADCCGFF